MDKELKKLIEEIIYAGEAGDELELLKLAYKLKELMKRSHS